MSCVSVAARCDIATAFVTMTFDCAMDSETVHDKRWPCVLFVPKAADATITDAAIVNTTQDDVYATGGLLSSAMLCTAGSIHQCMPDLQALSDHHDMR